MEMVRLHIFSLSWEIYFFITTVQLKQVEFSFTCFLVNSLLAQSHNAIRFWGFFSEMIIHCFSVKNPQNALHYGIVQVVNDMKGHHLKFTEKKMAYNKQLTYLTSSGSYRGILALRHFCINLATTLGQYSPVWTSCTVSKRFLS